jgi:two-component system chemotaxis sensor kinase CheA
MNPLLAQFIPEARDLLEQAGAGMLALERDAGSESVINDVFRAVHTLKGSSGLFDLMPLTRLVHAAEDLLDDVRNGDLALNSDIVDRLLDSLDVVSQWIDALEASQKLPGDAEAKMTERVAVLRSWLAQRSSPDGKLEVGSINPLAAQPPAWLAELPETDRISAFNAIRDRQLLAWSFNPEDDCYFRGDDPIAMLCHSPGLLAMRAFSREPFPDFDGLDPLSCLLRFEVLSDASRDALEEHMRYVADRVDICEIDPGDLAIPTGAPANGPLFGDFARLARQTIEDGDLNALTRSITTLLGMIAQNSLQASALRWCSALLASQGLNNRGDLERMIRTIETGVVPARGNPEPRDALPSLAPSVAVVSGLDPYRRDLALKIAMVQINVLETPTDAALAQGRLESVSAVLRNVLPYFGEAWSAEGFEHAITAVVQHNDLQPLRDLITAAGETCGETASQRHDDGEKITQLRAGGAAPANAPETLAIEPAGDNKAIPRVLRVDQSKIDSIMNLVAELIVAKNGLSYLAVRAEQVHGSRAAAREIKDQFSVIDRITQGLQFGVMSVRMMPVSQVFQRFPRLVRDISRKLGKTIELVIEGEDTEADKNVLESLADPLIHMVRNSLDHGIEPPDERQAAGKRSEGILRITARQENDFVVIEVSDDGRGIDPQRVKAKAIQLGLITAERAALLNDQEAANLVFAAGFSTKEEVSDLSGRGVGMDVVRSAVLKAGGDVSLRTTLGAGTSVTVRLPLTMAVTRIVTIECSGRIFGIPMDVVAETVRIKREQIHRVKDMETFVLRDAIIPMVRLARALSLSQPDKPPEEEAVMVVRVGGQRIGVVVDGFRERLEVIVKPLEGVLEGMRGFSGTALLGDGNVLLILDLQEML